MLQEICCSVLVDNWTVIRDGLNGLLTVVMYFSTLQSEVAGRFNNGCNINSCIRILLNTQRNYFFPYSLLAL